MVSAIASQLASGLNASSSTLPPPKPVRTNTGTGMSRALPQKPPPGSATRPRYEASAVPRRELHGVAIGHPARLDDAAAARPADPQRAGGALVVGLDHVRREEGDPATVAATAQGRPHPK